MCAKALFQEGPNVPTEEHALASLQRAVELGEVGELTEVGVCCVPRYLVTYMNSQTRKDQMRSATVVSVTNQSDKKNRVVVTFFKGLTSNAAPVGTAMYIIPPQWTIDFGSRELPWELTCVNSRPKPELTYDEGRAIVSSEFPEIGVSARVYYTAGEKDERLHAITDSKVVVYGKGNIGD